MAITRCPYCHAIIDEADKYCNNCGTQLLFSEDEEVEEEIPGEKIIDAEVEEKDYTVEEPEGEKKAGRAKDLDEEIDEDLKEEPPDGTEKTPLEELVTGEGLDDEDRELAEEVIVVDEIEASGPVGEEEKAERPEPALAPEEEGPEPEDEEAEEEELAEELEEDAEAETEEEPATAPAAAEAAPRAAEPPVCGPDEAEVEELAEVEAPDEAATAGEASLRPPTFDTRELENLGKTVELSREKIDKFIEVMAGKKTEAAPEPAREGTPEPPTGTLPPWASTMKGAPVFPDETGPIEARKVRGEPAAIEPGEVEIFPRRRGSDSTIGLPEKVAQVPLPFERAETGADEEEEPGEERAEEAAFEEGQEEAEEERPAPASGGGEAARPSREPILPVREPGPGTLERTEILPAGEAEEAEPGPPFSFSVFFKSKVFDLLFVGLFWLVALWLAASSTGTTLFDILGAMSGAMLLLYAVFVLIYFFLFKFFLGETLGDRLFRPRE